jgi:hypothetical protein
VPWKVNPCASIERATVWAKQSCRPPDDSCGWIPPKLGGRDHAEPRRRVCYVCRGDRRAFEHLLFSFAAAQLPLGVAIDRCSPKRCMLVCGIAVIAGRLVLPDGAAGVYARTFRPDRFTALAGLQLGLGSHRRGAD